MYLDLATCRLHVPVSRRGVVESSHATVVSRKKWRGGMVLFVVWFNRASHNGRKFSRPARACPAFRYFHFAQIQLHVKIQSANFQRHIHCFPSLIGHYRGLSPHYKPLLHSLVSSSSSYHLQRRIFRRSADRNDNITLRQDQLCPHTKHQIQLRSRAQFHSPLIKQEATRI